MSWWKWVGLAGVAGVAATGAVVVRDQRRRTAMSPDDVRGRLHQRVEDLERVEAEAEARAAGRSPGRAWGNPAPRQAVDRS